VVSFRLKILESTLSLSINAQLQVIQQPLEVVA
jgi:hypothetical protein